MTMQASVGLGVNTLRSHMAIAAVTPLVEPNYRMFLIADYMYINTYWFASRPCIKLQTNESVRVTYTKLG